MSDLRRTIGSTTIERDGLVYRAVVRDKFDMTEEFISRDGIRWFKTDGTHAEMPVQSYLFYVYEGWLAVLAAEGISL